MLFNNQEISSLWDGGSAFEAISIGLHLVREPSSLKALVAMTLLSSVLPCILYFNERAKKSSTRCCSTSRSCIFQSHVFMPSRNSCQVHFFSSVISQESKSVGILSNCKFGTLPMMHSSSMRDFMISIKFSLVTPFLSASYL